jgi:hypothetical protein
MGKIITALVDDLSRQKVEGGVSRRGESVEEPYVFNVFMESLLQNSPAQRLKRFFLPLPGILIDDQRTRVGSAARNTFFRHAATMPCRYKELFQDFGRGIRPT